ncbi:MULTISPECIES: 50S ribosomal protein L32 [Mycoplasma mycoides group]|uniref:Large ribosomal subunit protein bL32 n=9 Tax=Mycoplasma mycoides group TaxID=656088 RepID=RL32_MYCMS|nr:MULTISPECIES: 50S ribosomal protein L32 [Mycoplasma mycoides group]Q2SS97.1 RecName: Full=Large ribosomal subunit protein bL32; AltName: Full=50S ribosomal protein L32 [Mycoplasma capricolum subsp. capricolum ATCC 27343]Q6MT20.1 RecName: Full=Large ribosomal subunit protein bL32; AltName: Full=50S ribosomal protein L32 [Mycoplasma mycoides subsp. mycoides SC str. PG1]ADH21527.1 ribosomal protein L32 [synthetic Mycoplasma mycoides JCVI-syn1.0]AMW76552.1 L32: ribosomal protein L32 [synthetic b
MAVPFRKTSKSAKNKRRSHLALSAASLVSCTNCGAMIKPHHVCKECGFYKNKEVKVVEA